MEFRSNCYSILENWNVIIILHCIILARGSQGGSSGGRPSRGESISADKAKAQDRRGSVYGGGRRQSEAKGSLGGMGKKKSVEMSKESKLKQKKAEEAALRKNKVGYFQATLWQMIFRVLCCNHDNVDK